MPYVILFFSVVNLLLGVVVYIQGKKEKEIVTFFIFGIISSLWTFNNFYLRLHSDVLFLRSAYGLGSLVVLFGLVWVYFFLKQPASSLIKIIILLSSLGLTILTIYSDYVVKSLTSIDTFGYIGEVGPAFPFYSLYLGIIISIIIYKLASAFFVEPEGLRRNQILYILYGALIFAIISSVVSFLLPTFFGTFRFSVLDNFGSSVFLLFIAYAIIRLRLFNIEIITAEFITFGMWIFIFIRTLISKNPSDIYINALLLLFLVAFGIFLIRNVIRVIKNKEEIETLNLQLNKSMNELKKIDELKTDFVNLASHQLRTPLTPIKGFSDMLLRGDIGGPVINESQKSAVQTINTSAQRMSNLIDDLLDVSKLEKEGGFTYVFQITNPEVITKKIIDDFAKQANDKGLTLSFTSNISPATNIKLDPAKFTDAISNLVSNSLKYTLKGSITVTLTEDETNIVISIKDTGVGIEKDDIPRLFQKFFRGKEMARLDAEGTGLGLYFTRHVVEDHGGHITVQSEGPGKGSEFIVRLPKVTSSQELATNNSKTSADKNAEAVVEDIPHNAAPIDI